MADGKLKEVEEAAIRIQTKRFNDHFEELDYQNAKRAEEQSQEAKVTKTDNSGKDK